MSIKEIAEKRANVRGECRVVADELMKTVLERIDKLPEEHQYIVVSMLMSELQIATRKAEKL